MEALFYIRVVDNSGLLMPTSSDEVVENAE